MPEMTIIWDLHVDGITRAGCPTILVDWGVPFDIIGRATGLQ